MRGETAPSLSMSEKAVYFSTHKHLCVEKSVLPHNDTKEFHKGEKEPIVTRFPGEKTVFFARKWQKSILARIWKKRRPIVLRY